ncbi:MAG TPA: metal ABC transporter substrate-binding protein [Bacilli bacterium]|nr:metal ABC transporter substrate-binding protein [Bacilli bacterium]
MKKLLLVVVLLSTLVLTGCFKRDEMENINIITTVYPIEYITSRLYGDSSSISSIYPKAVDYTSYTMTNKQIKDYSNKDLFIYNGLDFEREYATTFLNKNKKLKIIDASYGISYNYNSEEVWLNPSNMLMMAQNIRNDLQNYISNPYLIEEINDDYEELKVDITQIDTELTLVASASENKQIIVADETLNFLSKYEFSVINLYEKDAVVDKNMKLAESLFKNKTLSYIFVMDDEELSKDIQKLVDTYEIEVLSINTLATISDEDLSSSEDYLSIMYNNISQIKKETFN